MQMEGNTKGVGKKICVMARVLKDTLMETLISETLKWEKPTEKVFILG